LRLIPFFTSDAYYNGFGLYLKDTNLSIRSRVPVVATLDRLAYDFLKIGVFNTQQVGDIVKGNCGGTLMSDLSIEKGLLESEDIYKALFEGTAEGILVADIQTKEFLFANPAMCKMLGYTEEELLN